MKDEGAPALAALDRREISAFLFHPRLEHGVVALGGHEELRVPVDDGVVVGGRWYAGGRDDPVLLFFHGNGEIVADYADLAMLYRQIGLHFVPFDYRGYGRSTGRPTVSTMIADARRIHDYVKEKMQADGYGGPLLVMGRSLGSASALELAAASPDSVLALIIESGFAHTVPLLALLGVDVKGLGLDEDALRQTNKIAAFSGPTLIIHGEQDQIIPFGDAEDLYAASPAEDKRLLRVEGGSHNNLLAVALRPYMEAVAKVAAKASAAWQARQPRREV
jgi:hypothetical protein